MHSESVFTVAREFQVVYSVSATVSAPAAMTLPAAHLACGPALAPARDARHSQHVQRSLQRTGQAMYCLS